MGNCPECGEPIDGSHSFCPHCGCALGDGQTQERVTVSLRQEGQRASERRQAEAGSSAHGRFTPGQMLGERFRIVGLLGRGGMGEVYRADDLELGQSVALKFLPERLLGDDVALQRLRGEVRTARQISHPNVCRVYDISQIDGHVFLSMEYIDGEDLANTLTRIGRPSAEKAAEFARQICLGLAAAHENGVLHRDLKPANIMIDGRGRARITDFGLAGLADELEATNERAGTPAYMAPEQLEHGTVSVRSDIYSLGLLLYELFTGKRAIEGDSIDEVRRNRSGSSISRSSTTTQPIDPAIERVINRCLDDDPNHRPSSVYAVLGALPGGDPIAAALAAGEMPSPELVAGSRDRAELRPVVSVALLSVSLLIALAIAMVNQRIFAVPESSPNVLTIKASQALEALGYDAPPEHTAEGFAKTWLATEGRESANPADLQPLHQDAWPAPYVYWKRWSASPLLSEESFYEPWVVAWDSPPMARPGDARVFLSSTGRLRSLVVMPDGPLLSNEATDWSPLFPLFDLDIEDLAPADPVLKPPFHCDETRAWRVEKEDHHLDQRVIHAGAANGRITWADTRRPEEFPPPESLEVPVFHAGQWFVTSLTVLGFVIAWRNVRRRRSDLKRAFHLSLLMMGVFLCTELLTLLQAGYSFSSTLQDIVTKSAGGYIVIRGVMIFAMYLAIEPYVRKVWPQLLVGLLRFLSGQIRDPRVGKELLIGGGAGIAIAGAIIAVAVLQLGSFEPDVVSLSGTLLESLITLPNALNGVLAAASLSIVLSMGFMVTLVVARLVTSSRRFATAGAGTVFSSLWVLAFLTIGEVDVITAVLLGALVGLSLAAIVTTVGLLAGFCVLFCLFISFDRPLFLAPDDWWGAYSIPSVLAFILPVVLGFVISISGQPIFRDVLADDRPAAA